MMKLKAEESPSESAMTLMDCVFTAFISMRGQMPQTKFNDMGDTRNLKLRVIGLSAQPMPTTVRVVFRCKSHPNVYMMTEVRDHRHGPSLGDKADAQGRHL